MEIPNAKSNNGRTTPFVFFILAPNLMSPAVQIIGQVQRRNFRRVIRRPRNSESYEFGKSSKQNRNACS
jgi:hypothetical protein